MEKSKKNKLEKKHTQLAKKSDWDSLASCIIDLELAILKEKDAKELKLLSLKLEIYEAEKNSRVFDSFDMEYFLSKEVGIFEDDDYDFSDS